MFRLSVLLILFLILFYGKIDAQLISVQQKKAILQEKLLKLDSLKNILNDSLESLEFELIQHTFDKIGYPVHETDQKVYRYSAMALEYAEEHEQARWVMHQISPKVADGAVGRSNDFRIDSNIVSGSAVEADYFLTYEENGETRYDGFGYDRGHLAPSADFRWSKKALSESFYYSNMSPQLAEFNREIWASLESLVRSYVIRTSNPLLVVTGPILVDDLPKVERSLNKLSIPKHYYKVMLDVKKKRAIGFFLPHQKCESELSFYSLAVDSVEKLSGLNFFPLLDSAIQEKVEQQNEFFTFFPLESGDITPIPFSSLNKNQFNTEVAKEFIGMKKEICGTVVSAYRSSKGNVFLNLDKQFPRTVFSINIWSSNLTNFSYQPDVELVDKRVCVVGYIKERDGVPNVSISHEKAIQIIH